MGPSMILSTGALLFEPDALLFERSHSDDVSRQCMGVQR
jgi:hypothetical protein